MRIKGVLIVTFAIVFTIISLIFHLLALFGQRWTVAIPRQARNPNDHPHYYGLWRRCQYSNTSFVIPDILSQPNIENFVCRPNEYLQYDLNNEQIAAQCYESRHQCSSIIGVHSNCRCRFLTVTKAQQWLTIIAAVFLLFAIVMFYLKIIASPQNASAAVLLSYSPVLFLSLALLSMMITMILLGAFLRRNEYEDYDVKLPKNLFNPAEKAPLTVNFYRLKSFFRRYPNSSLSRQALSTFESIHRELYHARIDWSSIWEIVSIVFVLLAEILSVILAIVRVN